MISRGPGHANTISLDTMLDALADQYRWRLLAALLEHTPQHDDDTQVPADVHIEDEDREALQIEMRHIHLPKLEQAGFIEWDREANVIRTGPQFEETQPLLQLMYDHADELPDDWL